MGWKNWPYWLKGGIIGTAAYLIYFTITFPFSLYIPYELGLCINEYGAGIFNCNANNGLNFWFVLFLSIILFVIVCSIISWIYGKIKSKN